MRHPKDETLHKLLRAAGLSIIDLAVRVGSGRPHVSQVLNNVPHHGGQTRRKLAGHLTPEILAHLGWDAAGNVIVPHGTTSDVERGARRCDRVSKETRRYEAWKESLLGPIARKPSIDTLVPDAAGSLVGKQ